MLATESQSTELDRQTEARIETFCSDCHALPRAESFPRDAWHDKVLRGYQFYAKSGRNDLDVPPIRLAVSYFRQRAPRMPEFSIPADAPTALPVSFTVEKFAWSENESLLPAISHLRWGSLQAGVPPRLLACDMRSGRVATIDVRNAAERPRVLAQLNYPCQVEPCDLDGDGFLDLVVADLGSFTACDHDQGRVVWLRRLGTADAYESIVVASGLGRVADVRAADLDADGKLDLLVAEFGHYKTGSVIWLRNVSTPDNAPRFELRRLDPRPGTIHVPTADFNGDGRPDFVAAVSQEVEQVDLFLNAGDGRFAPHNLWTAPDLTFGSSGIELVDLDQDGDLDILYTNGDAFDNLYVNPAHGIQWLENRGDLQFTCHRLTDLLGAYRALAGDIDGDGDLDILAVAWLPEQVKPAAAAAAPLPSIVCLEQTAPGTFVRHTLETGFPYYATLALADFDGDGDLDFAVGPHVSFMQESPNWIAVWWNTLRKP